MTDKLCALLVGFVLAVPVAAKEEQKPAPVTYLDQGWSPQERQTFYTTPQGSWLIPYRWFLHLEQPGNQKLFRADANLERFNCLPNPKEGKLNPDGLPVGFVKESLKALSGKDRQDIRLLRAFLGKDAPEEEFPPQQAWLGVTCAACHTAQIEYKGKRLRIDGGPTLTDFMGFLNRLSGAVDATLEDDAKFARFAGKVLGGASPQARKNLRAQLQRYARALIDWRARNEPPYPAGFGRLDAFGAIMNEVLGTALEKPANVRPADAPVSYPHLWLTPQLAWVQWNGSQTNPFARNIGEVVGVFGHVETTAPSAKGFASTARGSNIFALEQMVDRLKPPVWNEEVLGKIDTERAKRGAVLYGKNGCAKCHGNKSPYPQIKLNPQADKQFLKVTMVPLAEIGTDPAMATNFHQRMALPGVFGKPQAPALPGGKLLEQFVKQVVVRQFLQLKLSAKDQVVYSGFRPIDAMPPDLKAYKVGPLAGVWATAPYLHNGSVPSLYQLLLPPNQRVRQFYVGSRHFDPKRVGFDIDRRRQGFLFRTNVPGNSNQGHDYGTKLSPEQRWDLIEYLKTL